MVHRHQPRWRVLGVLYDLGIGCGAVRCCEGVALHYMDYVVFSLFTFLGKLVYVVVFVFTFRVG